MEKEYAGQERRKFLRLEYVSPVAYKVCKKETISKLFEGYTINVSETGLFCNIKEKVDKDDILWISFDKGILIVCKEMENRSLIYQNGIIGKVVRVIHGDNGTYNIGVQFITREEKNLTHIYPKSYFVDKEQEKNA